MNNGNFFSRDGLQKKNKMKVTLPTNLNVFVCVKVDDAVAVIDFASLKECVLELDGETIGDGVLLRDRECVSTGERDLV